MNIYIFTCIVRISTNLFSELQSLSFNTHQNDLLCNQVCNLLLQDHELNNNVSRSVFFKHYNSLTHKLIKINRWVVIR